MLELINEIKKIRAEYGEQVFIDNMNLNSGYYLKLTDKNITESDFFRINGKFESDDPADIAQYNWFKIRAYYNCLLNNTANKCVAGAKTKKKILSVVPFALTFKFQNLFLNDFDTYIKSYLEEIKAYADGELDELYYYSIFLDKIKELRLLLKYNENLKLKDTDSLFLYLDEDVQLYKDFYNIYLKRRLFLSEDTCINIDGDKLGLLSYSMSLNKPKKPTLSSTTINISFEDAEAINLISKLNYKINNILNEYSEQKYNLQFSNRDIKQYDKYLDLQNKYYYNDYFILRERNNENVPEPKYITKYELMSIIDSNFSHGALNNSFKADIKQDVEALNNYIKFANKTFSDTTIVQQFINHKDVFYEYFYRDANIEIATSLENLLKLIYEYNYVNKYSRSVLCSKFDMILNIMIYVSQKKEKYENMASNIKQIQNDLIACKNNNVIEITSDESFYYIAGQILQYLSSLSESQDKNYHDIFEYYNLKNIKQIKRKIIEKYSKYGYKLPTYSEAFINLAYQEVLAYNLNNKNIKNLAKSELWYYYNAGLVGQNIFYIKKDKKVGNRNEE